MSRLALALTLPLLACDVGDSAPGEDAAPSETIQVSGALTESATWSGAVEITGDTQLVGGTTITVEPGTIITVADGARVLVRGTLDVRGTGAGKVTIRPADPEGFHGGFSVDGGGTLTVHFGVLTGGGVYLGAGGTANLVDTRMSRAPGDLLTMDGGTVVMDYSQIGVDPGESDTTHCDMHFDGDNVNSIRVTHSNITTSAYGIMFYAGTGAVFTNNNWYGNLQYSVHTLSPFGGRPGVTADFTGSWFDARNVVAATGTTLTGLVVDPSLPRNVAGPRS